MTGLHYYFLVEQFWTPDGFDPLFKFKCPMAGLMYSKGVVLTQMHGRDKFIMNFKDYTSYWDNFLNKWNKSHEDLIRNDKKDQAFFPKDNSGNFIKTELYKNITCMPEPYYFGDAFLNAEDWSILDKEIDSPSEFEEFISTESGQELLQVICEAAYCCWQGIVIDDDTRVCEETYIYFIHWNGLGIESQYESDIDLG